MMKLNLIAVILFVFVGLSVFADDDHTANVCSTVNPQICAHIGHMTGLKSDSEAQFVAHLILPAGAQATDIAIKLWMPEMGHGSSPVTITPMGANQFQVTEAYFIMAGTWDVQISFKIGTDLYQLSIPVEIAE